MAMKQAFWMAFGCAVAMLVLLAVLTMAGSLLVAAILPRGHPLADRLRAFAARVPDLAVHGALWLRTLVVVGGIGLLVFLILVNDPSFHS
ncbi:hypothetical protein [Variovorax sp. OK605]|uniref:hypothetical protein n=1 Tax=Variovorax sp. OK605 TaxID=1855317 RepID=UPI000B843194|nr:hypothetical protein [Variovorax sp. OK605]